MPPYSSGISTEVKPSSAALASNPRITPGSFASMASTAGVNFFTGKLRGGSGDLALLVRQVLGSKHLCRCAGFDEKTAALGCGNGGSGNSGHQAFSRYGKRIG